MAEYSPAIPTSGAVNDPNTKGRSPNSASLAGYGIKL